MSHLALDSFGDLDDAAADPHVSGCTQCQQELAQQHQVRAALASLPDPGPLPAEVSDQIAAALAALPASAGQPTRQPAARPTGADGDVVPLDRERARRRPRRPLLAAAAALAVLGGGGYVVNGLAPEGRGASSAGASMEHRSSVAAAPDLGTARITSSGTEYTRARLAEQVEDVLLGRRGAALSLAGRVAPEAVTGCLQALEATDATPLLVDSARFEGEPALLLVLRTPEQVREVWVVAPSCGPGADGLRYYGRLP